MIITGEYKRGVTKLKKTTDYRRPETVDVDEWKKELEQAWGRVDKTKIQEQIRRRECGKKGNRGRNERIS